MKTIAKSAKLGVGSILACLALAAVPAGTIAACAASENATEIAAGGSGPASGAQVGVGPGTGGNLSVGATGSGGLDKDAACATVQSQAQKQLQPADIVIAVDTSGSMVQEAGWVQQNLNGFSSLITQSGIDAHVVLIADDSVCIPPPLGSGSCPADDNLPIYRHVHQGVDSNNAPDLFVSTYPQWKASLRTNATKTLAVVSDDNSDISASTFTMELLALDPPTFQGFKFDAIVSFDDPSVCASCALAGCNCASKCCDKTLFCTPISAAAGTVYKDLTQQTMGVLGDLCAQNFGPIFKDMATAVVQGAKVSCEFDIPPPPNGQTIDPGKVNVTYTPGGTGNPEQLLNVPMGSTACGSNGGWYYDNAQSPTKILLCPSTCTKIQSDATAVVDVLFGCDTKIVPPN